VIVSHQVRKGLISKIFLIAYCERITPYKIAELIYGRDEQGNVRMPNNIYREVKKYSYLLDRNKKGILSKAKPLFSELIKEFRRKDKILNENEKEKLYKYLDGKFRDIVRDFGYISDEKSCFDVFLELIEKYPPTEGKLNQKVKKVPTLSVYPVKTNNP